MERPGGELWGIVTLAARRAAARPGLLLLLLGAHLSLAGASWLLQASLLPPELAGDPPGLFAWAVALGSGGRLARLITVWGGALLLHLLVSDLLGASALGSFKGQDLVPAGYRYLLRLVGLRLCLGLPALGVALGFAFTVAPAAGWAHEVADDERVSMALPLLYALPFALPAGFLLLLLPFCRACCVRGDLGLGGSLRAGFGLVHRQPLVCGGLFALGWLFWVAVTALFIRAPLESPLLAQVPVLLRTAAHLWSLAAAWEATSTVDIRGPMRGPRITT